MEEYIKIALLNFWRIQRAVGGTIYHTSARGDV
jgi:hypothetical protein